MPDEPILEIDSAKCDHADLHHDKFEDMYRCNKCGLFFDPEELGKSNDENAGYKKLSLANEKNKNA